jgi:predicted butyrate kinase (DUF1464 family)
LDGATSMVMECTSAARCYDYPFVPSVLTLACRPAYRKVDKAVVL